MSDEWSKGFFCAVGILIREAGHVTTEAQSVFSQGGSPLKADADDIALFVQHGLVDKRHGPAPTPIKVSVRNPFRSNERRKQFDAMVADYESRNTALFRADGRENQANNIGNAFWRGFHNQIAAWVDQATPLYVAYAAGREIGRSLREKTGAAQ